MCSVATTHYYTLNDVSCIVASAAVNDADIATRISPHTTRTWMSMRERERERERNESPSRQSIASHNNTTDNRENVQKHKIHKTTKSKSTITCNIIHVSISLCVCISLCTMCDIH